MKTKFKEIENCLRIFYHLHGLSPKTYQRAKTIIENGKEVKEKLRQGKTTISKE